MSDLIETVQKLRRPGLLVRAAKLGSAEYNRSRELRRLIPGASTPAPEKAVKLLLEEENELERYRVIGDASYSVMRHVRVMVALVSEIKLLRRAATEST